MLIVFVLYLFASMIVEGYDVASCCIGSYPINAGHEE